MSLKNYFSSNSKDSPNDFRLLQITEERQKIILKALPQFAYWTIFFAFIGFALTSYYQWKTGNLPRSYSGLLNFSNPSIGSIIALALTFFSTLMMWVFVIWSLSFIPFIAYRAHRASEIIKLPVGTKSFRWLQLYATTVLPVFTFAVAWSSIPSNGNFNLSIENLSDGFLIVVFGLLIWSALWIIVEVIPKRLVAIHIAFLSTLLYTSLFLAYGFGYGEISYSTLFAILFFLTFSFNKLEEIGRRITTYDLNPLTAENISKLMDDISEVSSKSDEIIVDEMKLDVEKRKNDQFVKKEELENEKNLQNHIGNIRKTEIDFNKNVQETSLKVFNEKANFLNKMYETLATELGERIKSEFPSKLQELSEDAKKYSPKELQLKMKVIYNEMNKTLSQIPESLADLKKEMNQAVLDMKSQAQLLVANEQAQTTNTEFNFCKKLSKEINDFNIGVFCEHNTTKINEENMYKESLEKSDYKEINCLKCQNMLTKKL